MYNNLFMELEVINDGTIQLIHSTIRLINQPSQYCQLMFKQLANQLINLIIIQ